MQTFARLFLPAACVALTGCCGVTTADKATSIQETFREYRSLVVVADEAEEAKAYRLAQFINEHLDDLAKGD